MNIYVNYTSKEMIAVCINKFQNVRGYNVRISTWYMLKAEVISYHLNSIETIISIYAALELESEEINYDKIIEIQIMNSKNISK